MKLTHGLAAIGLTLAAAAAHADITGTVTAVSDYDFRGITQTAQDPALQGSIDYTHSSGFYLGAWGSNVDFGDCCDENVEVDVYAGTPGVKHENEPAKNRLPPGQGGQAARNPAIRPKTPVISGDGSSQRVR